MTIAPTTLPTQAPMILNGSLDHIAIIMDGNRRWEKKHRLPPGQGHFEGYKALKRLLEYCSKELKLPILTVYAFSTENWQRPSHEVQFLMKLFQKTLKKELPGLIENQIRLKFLGCLDGFSPAFQKDCREAEEITKTNTGMLYQVAMNYGSRAEISHACRKIAEEVQAGNLAPEEITEAHLQKYLYTGDTKDPDLVIRTGGEYRLSNFLMWQSAYSEICIVEELWPEFTPEVLNKTINDFQTRQRRFGK